MPDTMWLDMARNLDRLPQQTTWTQLGAAAWGAWRGGWGFMLLALLLGRPLVAQQAPLPPATRPWNVQHDGPTAPLPGESIAPQSPLVGEVYHLADVVGLALARHPALVAAAAEVHAAQGRAWQAGRLPNPDVAFGSPQVAGSSSQYNVLVSQELYPGRKLQLDQAALERVVNQARWQWVRTKYNVLAEVREQFYVTLVAESRVAALERLVETMRQSVRVAQRWRAAGEAPQSDVLLLQVEMQRAEMLLVNARTQVETARRQLTLRVAWPGLMIGGVSGDVRQPLPEVDPLLIEQAVVTQHTTAQQARIEVSRTLVRLERERVQPVPEFNLQGGYQWQAQPPDPQQGVFQISMSVPLWNRNQGGVRMAQANVQAARAGVQRVELELSQLATAAVNDYHVARQRVVRFEQEILPRAQEVYRLSQTLYTRGEVDFLRLLQAQRTLIETELEYLDAQDHRWRAAVGIADLLQLDAFPDLVAPVGAAPLPEPSPPAGAAR